MSADAWTPIPCWPGYEGTPDGRLRHARTRRELAPSGPKRTYTLKGGGLCTTATAGGVAARVEAALAGVACRRGGPPARAAAPAEAAAPTPPEPAGGPRLSRRDAAALEDDRRRHAWAVKMRGNGCDWIPSPDEIRAACAAIRAEWDPVREAHARGLRLGDDADAMLGCRLDRLDRVFRRNGRTMSRRAS